MIKYVYYKIWKYFYPRGVCLDFQAETQGGSAVDSDVVDSHGHKKCCAFPSFSFPITNNDTVVISSTRYPEHQVHKLSVKHCDHSDGFQTQILSGRWVTTQARDLAYQEKTKRQF